MIAGQQTSHLRALPVAAGMSCAWLRWSSRPSQLASTQRIHKRISDLRISGRIAVVTGASAAIGFAVAEELVANAASVLIAARDAARISVEFTRAGEPAEIASIAAYLCSEPNVL